MKKRQNCENNIYEFIMAIYYDNPKITDYVGLLEHKPIKIN
jgi:hypothetical protein